MIQGSRQWATALMVAALVMAGGSAQADEWDKLVQHYLAKGVKPTRVCSQDTGACANGFRDGNAIMFEVENKNGVVAARVMCKFDLNVGRRTCVNFDTRQRTVAVYTDGRWVDE